MTSKEAKARVYLTGNRFTGYCVAASFLPVPFLAGSHYLIPVADYKTGNRLVRAMRAALRLTYAETRPTKKKPK